MQHQYHAQITINAPSIQVFEYIVNLKNYHLWNGSEGLIENSPSHMANGVVFYENIKYRGRISQVKNTITKYLPLSQIGFTSELGNYKITGEYHIAPKPFHSEVTAKGLLSLQGTSKLSIWTNLFGHINVNHQASKNLQRLKRYTELAAR